MPLPVQPYTRLERKPLSLRCIHATPVVPPLRWCLLTSMVSVDSTIPPWSMHPLENDPYPMTLLSDEAKSNDAGAIGTCVFSPPTSLRCLTRIWCRRPRRRFRCSDIRGGEPVERSRGQSWCLHEKQPPTELPAGARVYVHSCKRRYLTRCKVDCP